MDADVDVEGRSAFGFLFVFVEGCGWRVCVWCGDVCGDVCVNMWW